MAYFAYEYADGPFQLFSAAHVMSMLFIGCMAVLIILFRKPLERSGRQTLIRYTLATVLLLCEVSKQIWLIWSGGWSITFSLPLHISSITLITAVIMLLTRQQLITDFTYFAGIGSAIQAIITPDLGTYDFPHFRAILFFISHGGVIIACTYMIAVEHVRPHLRSIWRTYLVLNAYAACIFVLNSWIGSNYLFVSRAPSGPSILDYLGPWPLYLLSMQLVALVTFGLLYTPFWIRDRLHASRKEV